MRGGWKRDEPYANVCKLRLPTAERGYMATEIWVNIGSGNGLLPDGTKPLPETMWTYHQ